MIRQIQRAGALISGASLMAILSIVAAAPIFAKTQIHGKSAGTNKLTAVPAVCFNSECAQSIVDCRPLAGSMADLWIRVSGPIADTTVLPGLGTTDDPALTIEAGYVPSDSEIIKLARSMQFVPLRDFLPSPSLTEDLRFTPYRSRRQYRADSLLKSGADITAYADAFHEAHFTFTLPEVAVGRNLWLRVTYITPDGRAITSTQSSVVSVEAPCSVQDLAIVLGSHIYLSVIRYDYIGAIALADTMIQRGWSHLTGLEAARIAASIAGRYDKAIQFLDYTFTKTGQVGESTTGVPADSATARQEYERLRELLQGQAEQQQR